MPLQCHFVVSSDKKNPVIHPTECWQKQRGINYPYPSGHNYVESIGICITGDFSNDPPDKEKFRALVILVKELQKTFDVNADSVYLQKELDPASRIPGKAFPTTLFNSNLLRLED